MNAGERPCSLSGIPSIQILDWQGLVMSTTQHPVGRPRVTVLLPHQRVGVGVQWFNWCAQWPGARTYAEVRFTFRVTMPGWTTPVSVPFSSGQPRCDSPTRGSFLDVSPFEAIPLHPSAPAPEPPPLTATLSAPTSVGIGSTITYEVTLTNRSNKPFEFDSCPAYRESIGIATGGGWNLDREYVLNCGSVGALAPGASATFVMEIPVPSDAAPGLAGLFWTMEPDYRTLPGPPVPGSGPGTKAALTVTA
jgi:hypothetical protein